MNTRAALAVILFVALGFTSHFSRLRQAPITSHPRAEPVVIIDRLPRIPPPSPRDLPDDCAIIASEAASRLAATGAWTRIVHVTLLTRSGGITGHAVCIWQPPTCSHVFVYDEYMIGGSVDTGVVRHSGSESHDLKKIVISLSRLTHIPVLEAHFVA